MSIDIASSTPIQSLFPTPPAVFDHQKVAMANAIINAIWHQQLGLQVHK
jgi:hypothetical protein